MFENIFIDSTIFFIIGLMMGSFLNCLAWRLYKEESIMGRSHCPKCLQKIHWFDNIPVLSFFFLQGRCRSCKQTISWRYPVIELLTAILFVAAFISFGSISFWLLLKVLIFIFVLVLVFIFDLFWYLIPVSALVWASLVILPLTFISNNFSIGQQLFATIASVLAAIVFFGLQYVFTKGKGLGEGDIWLGSFLALFFSNLSLLIVAVLSAYFIGAVVGLLLIAFKGKKMNSQVPLGVFLVIGAVIALFYGQDIVVWYSSLIGY